MKLLGIQKDHNSSVSLFKNNNLVYYNQENRLSRIKNFSGFPFLCIEQILKKYKNVDKVILTGYDNNDTNVISKYLKHIKLIENIEKQTYIFFKSHHLIHAAKSFFDSDFTECLIFVIDGRGSSYVLSNGKNCYETTSVYMVEKDMKFNCLYKKLFTDSKIYNEIKVNFDNEIFPYKYAFTKILPVSLTEKTIFELSNDNDLGHFYKKISEHFGWKSGEGKLMGLSAYGQYDSTIFNMLNDKNFFTNNLKLPLFEVNEKNKNNLQNLSYCVQKKFEEDYFNLITKFLNKHNCKNIILTGGTALNVINNYKLKQKLGSKINLYIDPLCGDEGNSIGACKLFFNMFYKKNKKTKNLYIGGKYNFNVVLKKNEICYENVKINKIVDILTSGNILALYQKRAEAGPRALGNRSLLLDPRIFDGKNIMNTVKKREQFRPFACSILKEKAFQWFDMSILKDSPFMMYATTVLKQKKNIINSIVHIDNTCRIQTVTNKCNYVLYNILKEFDRKTGVPILMNTSFNLNEEPIVETPEDAINTLRKSKIEYLYVPEKNKLFYIKNYE
jgi:carbamoyltransferase